MRVTIDQFKMGLAKYIDNEIVAKINGFGKWLIPLAGASLINGKVEPMLKDYHDMLVQMGYLTEDNLIDIDKIHADMKRISHEKGSIVQHFPLIGDVTFSESDIDAIRRFMN